MNRKRVKVSIIYAYYNTPDEIINSVLTIRDAMGDFSYEIIIIDNASKNELPQKIITDNSIRIIKNATNLGYGKALNQGAKVASGEFLLLVNPDTKFLPRSLELLVRKGNSDSRIGIVGPQVLNTNGKILQSISNPPLLPDSLFVFSFLRNIFPFSKYVERYHRDDLDRNKMQEVNTVSGVCMLMRKSLFNKINGFDEQFFMYFEEADICYRVKKLGYKIIYLPSAKIVHLVGRSSIDKEWIKKTFEKSRFLFFKKHHGLLPAIMAEAFIRFFTLNSLLVLIILSVSAFLNLYKLDTLMMFFGDFGRDYLAARDMLLTGNIPLVGIPSSVVWLHQGPLSIYLISLALKIGNFHPVAPAILYGIIGVTSTLLVYWVSKT
ncbi:glycosyltransferase, partial [Candidatus Roizmanbacteria bacterium]|nr:glycosyltransferase [Candidatus Roizmanbacteria bacterium]